MIETIKNIIRPEFFDIFGIPVFITILFIGLRLIYKKRKVSRWIPWTLIVIGILGLIVDSAIVFNTYLK